MVITLLFVFWLLIVFMNFVSFKKILMSKKQQKEIDEKYNKYSHDFDENTNKLLVNTISIITMAITSLAYLYLMIYFSNVYLIAIGLILIFLDIYRHCKVSNMVTNKFEEFQTMKPNKFKLLIESITQLIFLIYSAYIFIF